MLVALVEVTAAVVLEGAEVADSVEVAQKAEMDTTVVRAVAALATAVEAGSAAQVAEPAVAVGVVGRRGEVDRCREAVGGPAVRVVEARARACVERAVAGATALEREVLVVAAGLAREGLAWAVAEAAAPVEAMGAATLVVELMAVVLVAARTEAGPASRMMHHHASQDYRN